MIQKLILILIILTATYSRTFAQVPPGSILWLNASQGVVLQNGHVAQWKDQSGNGNDVFMTNAGRQPDLLASSYNGKPSILFNGGAYLQGPNIFPVNSDYTVAVVAKINNTANINNLVSGNSHAIWLYTTLYPRVFHGSFYLQEVGTVPMWMDSSSTVMAIYSNADQQAQLYVNGEFADSSYILNNSDSSLLIGSYIGGYFLQGEIQEILIYNRGLDSNERIALDTYLRTKYGIAYANPLPKPDSTFVSLPHQLQVYARGTDDSAAVPITGTMYHPGFDSIYVLQSKNGLSLSRTSEGLNYENGMAQFSFMFRIHSELSEYRFEVRCVSHGRDSVMVVRDSIVCGDIFLIDGQSDASFGYDSSTYSNEFCRTFGLNFSQNLRDTLWIGSQTLKWGDAGSVGAWGQRIQRNLVEKEQLPTCCINGAVSATNIGQHEPDSSDKYSLQTIYGRELYRATHSGLLSDVKAIFWEQGEANYAQGYYNQFLELYNGWKRDYPNLEKIYLIQNRPNYCYWGNIDMRDVQRMIGDSLQGVETIAKAAMPYYDGCHFLDSGFDDLGDRLFLSFARDFYHASDTTDLRCPETIGAYFTKPDHTQIAILFSPQSAQLHATDDTIVNGIFASLKDYLYPDDTSVHVSSVSFDADTLFVNLDNAGAEQSIGYLPDQHYNGSDSVIYEGPWIVNARGLSVLLWHTLPISDQPLSVKDQVNPNPDVVIIPNPASRDISIDASGLSGPVEATLVAETGMIVWQQSFPADHPALLSFDLSGESSGIYFLRLSNGHSNIERKFILER